MTTPTIYVNATVFTGDARRRPVDAFAVQGGRFLAAGDVVAVRAAAGPGATAVDLGGAFVMPGFVDGHVHLSMLGETLQKVALGDCRSVDEVRRRLADAHAAAPAAERILGAGWRADLFAAGERPTAAMLDELFPAIPVVLDASSLHAAWANTAGLVAMGITDATPDPVGGEIVRDARGTATGLLQESAAFDHAWRYAAAVATDADREQQLQGAFHAYLASGVTGATDMALDEVTLATLCRILERDGRLPFPVDAYWLVKPSGSLATDVAEVARAAAARDDLDARFGSRWLRVLGVKLILDGVIDTCTAAMRVPFANGALPAPIWDRAAAIPVAIAADAAGLQLALHAIGDEASTIALDAVQECARVNGPRARRRPRIEHLESVAEDTIARMAALGVTASMQPVHCDPAVLDNWRAMLGDERAERGFPWHRFREAGVPIALGTDAPTASHLALRNLFIALTARSARDASRAPYHSERVFTPADALKAYSGDPARAALRDAEAGRIAPGYRASFCVLDANPLEDDPERLLTGRVLATFVDGEELYRA